VIRRDPLVRAERQHSLAVAVPGATVHELDGDHAVGVREPVRFVPVLVDACLDVTAAYGRVCKGPARPADGGLHSEAWQASIRAPLRASPASPMCIRFMT
jgi:hypothetical protein